MTTPMTKPEAYTEEMLRLIRRDIEHRDKKPGYHSERAQARRLLATLDQRDETLSLRDARIEELSEENGALNWQLDRLHKAQTYTYIGRDGKQVLARDLEARAEAAEAKVAELRDVMIPTQLDCPACGVAHVDEGEWATRPHRTHECQSCGHLWRPYEVATVGVPTPPQTESK